MKLPFVPFFLILAMGICGAVRAQDGKSMTFTSHGTLAQNAKQSAQEIEDIGEIDEQGGKTSLRDKLRFNVDFRTAYTTNALLTGNNNHSDVLFLPTAEAGYHTALDKHFNFDLDTKLESAIYSRFQDRGFWGFDAIAMLDYHIKPGLPRFYASVEDYRYNSFSNGQLQTEAVGFIGGTDWGVPFNGGRSLGFVGYSFSDFLSDPQIDTRLVQRVVVGFAHQIRSNLTAQIYYTYEYDNYNEFARRDEKNTVAGALIYQFNDHWYTSLTTSYVDQGSTQDHASYQSFSTALGLTVHF